MTPIIEPFSSFHMLGDVHAERRGYRDGAEKLHYHDFFQCLIIIKGSVLHKQGNKEVKLQERDAFILPPGFPHEMYAPSKDLRFYSFSVCETFFARSQQDSCEQRLCKELLKTQPSSDIQQLRFHIRLDPVTFLSISSMMVCLIRELSMNTVYGIAISDHLISVILIMFSRIFWHDFNATEEFDLINEQNNAIRKCIHYIDINYMNPLSINDLAKKCALSRSAFYHNFTKTAGMSPRKYITAKRIEAARQLVIYNIDLQIDVIAQMVGFNEPATFYRNFRLQYGCTPAALRAQGIDIAMQK